MTKPHVVLIFGEPNTGKSWLADKLHTRYGYDVISVDEAYIEIIKEFYPKLYLDSLNIVISQHYNTILKRIHKGTEKAWAQYIIAFIEKRLNTSNALAVEGYLLEPVLKPVRRGLSKKASVSMVYVKDRQYFASATIKELVSHYVNSE